MQFEQVLETDRQIDQLLMVDGDSNIHIGMTDDLYLI